MLDFSNEQEQMDGASVLIPDGSICKVRMKLGSAGQYSAGHDSISKTSKGLLQLCVDFEFLSTDARDMRFQKITLPKSMQQNTNLEKGQVTACNIGGAQIKAILQACGNDACQLQAWEQLDGLEFPVLVGGEWNGDYWNNEFKKVITPNKDEFAAVMGGQDILSDKPIPEKPTSVMPQQSQPWGQQQNEPPSIPHPSEQDVPAWLK